MMRHSNERGIALITTLLVLMLISALLVGFTTVVMSDQRYRFIDRDRGQAFYAASGALEKMTSDLGNLFLRNVAPTDSQVAALTASSAKPSITDVTFASSSAPAPVAASELSNLHCYTSGGVTRQVRTVGSNGYTITFCANSSNNPTTTADPTLIRSGAYEGLVALKTPYQLDVTARTAAGGEVHLVRTIEAVAIPVFQFGIFSDVDLAFNAGDDFTFGGRVHTNGNLFLAEAGGSTLTIGDKITAVKEVVREVLSNGVSIDTSGHTGTVKIAKAPGSYITFGRNQGSVTAGPGSSQNEPTWHTMSLSTSNGYIRNGRTGAKALNLPLVTVGGSTPDVTKRPKVNEDNDNANLFNERLFSKASLRILLSDTAADIMSLPTVDQTVQPILLDGDWLTAAPAGYGAISSSRPPIALTPGLITTTVNNTGSTVNTIKVSTAGVRAFLPTMTLTSTGGVSQTIFCAVKDAANNRFTGCARSDGTAITTILTTNSTISAGPGVTGTVPLAVTGGTSVTLTLTSGHINRFMPRPFFIDDTLVTCTAWDTVTARGFTGCLGLSSGPANGKLITNSARSQAGTGLIGGYIKIEKQDINGVWSDVTAEILNYGIGGQNLEGTICSDPTPNAIVRLQRLRDNGGSSGSNGGGCSYDTDVTGAKDATNWWPNVLYDAREAVLRDSNYPGASTLTFNGVMHYVALDVRNLSRWFTGALAGTGANAKTDNGGFTVYFSDRRNNRDENSKETGEYGWEDFVNPGAVNGAPNNTLDSGEDVNADSVQQTYGGHPSYNGTFGAVPPGSSAPFVTTATPVDTLTDPLARVNRAIFFRRALKLVNGADIRAQGVTGLTIVAENPVYVQGDWNAIPGSSGGFSGSHAATAIIADAVTLLSNNWNDVTALKNPYAPSSRPRNAHTWYRVAIIGGKSMIFPHFSGTGSTFGTDGGTHAFLRFLEGNPSSGSDTIHYWGSMATFYYSRQATGVFKGSGTVVYAIPANRDFAFDTDFLEPSKLPPNTPMFRDMNAVGFSQELRPGR